MYMLASTTVVCSKMPLIYHIVVAWHTHIPLQTSYYKLSHSSIPQRLHQQSCNHQKFSRAHTISVCVYVDDEVENFIRHSLCSYLSCVFSIEFLTKDNGNGTPLQCVHFLVVFISEHLIPKHFV